MTSFYNVSLLDDMTTALNLTEAEEFCINSSNVTLHQSGNVLITSHMCTICESSYSIAMVNL